MRLFNVCRFAFRQLLEADSKPAPNGTYLFLLAALLLFTPPAKAAETRQPEEKTQKTALFLAAQSAYDDGRYAEAASLYEQLASLGIDNVELYYNLANAQFKNSNLPGAVLNYRKAWYKTPRDPDIGANLHFALNAAGAAEATPSFLEQLFNVLPRNGWIAVATGSYMAFTLLLILGLLIRSAKRILTKACLLPAVLILVSAAGWWHWRQFDIYPEWVVVKAGATTLFGPIEGSTAHFKIPPAALVRQCGIDPKGWVEIEYDSKQGWLKEAYIKRVYP